MLQIYHKISHYWKLILTASGYYINWWPYQCFIGQFSNHSFNWVLQLCSLLHSTKYLNSLLLWKRKLITIYALGTYRKIPRLSPWVFYGNMVVSEKYYILVYTWTVMLLLTLFSNSGKNSLLRDTWDDNTVSRRQHNWFHWDTMLMWRQW